MARVGETLLGGGHRSAGLFACFAALALALVGPSAARAADSIYWTEGGPEHVQVGNLNGTGPQSTLFTDDANSGPHGIAIDPAAGRIYWSNFADDRLRAANLDGSGTPTTLYTEATDAVPEGIGIDPAAGKIYWANFSDDQIRVGNTNGSGSAATLFTEAAGVNPYGVAIDPAAGKIYWTTGSGTVRVGNLDGSGVASTLFTDGADETLQGIAIDPAAGKIYWANQFTGTIRVGNLNGSGTPSTLYTEPFLNFVDGVAIDPSAGKIYWGTTFENAVRVGNLDGSGTAATLFGQDAAAFTAFVAVLRAPAGTGAPSISGAGQVGQPFTCGTATWAADLLGAFLYRAPRTVATEWTKDGAVIPGATTGSYTPTTGGSYACRAVAANQAGSTEQSSPSVDVANPPPPPTADPKCKRLRKKLKTWQARKLSTARTSAKRAYIQRNIRDTKRRLKKLGC